jgi:sigma-E factor negative regulatory protein RseA
MTTESHEHLSSLMDGEISRETGRFLVRRLGADEELCATWARNHLVRDCLRHGGGRFAGEGRPAACGGRSNVSRSCRTARKFPAWLKPVAGLAVAASVPWRPSWPWRRRPACAATSAGLAESAPPADAFTSPQNLSPTPISRQVSLAGGPAGDSRMNPYLLRHYQATGSTGGRGFVAFVPIVITSSAQAGSTVRDDSGEQAAEQVHNRKRRPTQMSRRPPRPAGSHSADVVRRRAEAAVPAPGMTCASGSSG